MLSTKNALCIASAAVLRLSTDQNLIALDIQPVSVVMQG